MKRALLPFLFCLLLVAASRSSSQILTESRTPSLQITVLGHDPKTGHYYVSVRNTSSRAVLRFCVGPSANGNTAWNSLIQPGDALPFGTNNSKFLVSSAIFADGSYEGDAETAAQMADAYIGDLVQFERIQKRMDEIVAGPASDEAKLEFTKEALAQLSDQPDAEMTERRVKDFPSLTQPHDGQVGYIGWAMKDRRTNMLAQIGLLQKSPPGMPLAQWWAAYKVQVAKAALPLDYQPN
jgi:hypothetical protein